MSAHALLDEVVRSHLKNLKLPAIARILPEVAREARQGGWPLEEGLRVLLEAELAQRAENVAQERLRAARFPAMKTFEQFDFAFQPTLDREHLLRLAHGDWIAAAEPVLFAGPVGTGKTHLAIALGVEATRQRYRVRFFRADDLVRTLTEARGEQAVGRLLAHLERVDVLLLDELGFVPFDRTGAELLFNLLARRYQHRATVVTTNLAFSEWGKVFGDDKLTAALLDRLGDRAHIITTAGASYRLRSTAALPGAAETT